MSQIKKLQNGKNVPKPTYGKLTIDAREYEATPELLEALGSYIGGLDPKHQRFLGDVEDALRKGQNISLNTHTNRISGLNGFSELNERQNRRSRRGSSRAGKIIDALTDSDVYQSNEAIALLGGFKYAQQAKENTPALIKVSNTPLNFDYDTKDGKSVYSTNPKNAHIKNRFQYYYDWLDEPDTFKTVYEWSNNPENEDILRSWYADLGEDALSRKNEAKKRIDAALAEVAAADGWDNVSEATRELLGYFNIGNEGGATTSTPEAETVARDKWRNPDGSVSDGSAAANGYGIWKGNHSQNENEEDDAYYTSSKLGASTPYMITEGDWDSLGLVGDYEGLRNGIIYKGRIYTPEQIAALTTGDLYNTMNRVRAANDDHSLTGAERWNTIGGLLDWRDEANGYGYYDYDPVNHFITNDNLRTALANGDFKNGLSFFDASNRWGLDSGRLLGFYDYSKPGTNAYGFRSPYYVYFDDSGNANIYTEEQLRQDYPDLNYDRYKTYSNFDTNKYFTGQYVNTNNGKMWVYKTVQNTNKSDSPYTILADSFGNLWLQQGNGDLVPVSEDLKRKINAGSAITPREYSTGKASFSGGSRKNGGKIFKDGGKVNYIKRLQPGGITSSALTVEEINPNNPSKQASNIFDSTGTFRWEDLPIQDREDLIAAGLDLTGAIAGFIGPVGSAVGAGLGLGSTGLMTDASRRRGASAGHMVKDALINTGLDVVSLVPWLGETGKFAKVGKVLKNKKVFDNLSKILIGAGFANVIPVLGKIKDNGFKSISTEDAYALSGALQASLGLGHRAKTNAGDRKLARVINESTSATPTATVHESNIRMGGRDIDVKLSETDINEIKGAGDNAAQLLRNKLKANYNLDDSVLGTNDAELLAKFGFSSVFRPSTNTRTIEYAAPADTKVRVESSNKPFKLEQTDVDHILKGGDAKDAGKRLRDLLIDRGADPSKINANDAKLLEQFGFGVKTRKLKNRGQVKDVSDDNVTVFDKAAAKVKDNESYTKRGVISDLFGGARKRREYIDKAMSNSETRSAIDNAISDMEAGTENALKRAYGRSQFRIGETPVEFGRRRLYRFDDEPKETETTTQQPTAAPQTTPAPEAPATPQPQTQVTPESPVQSAMRKAYETPAMLDVRERNAGRRAAKLQDTAANIKKLQNSKDPMKTLSELNSKVDKFDEMVFNNQEEFQAALNYALSRMPKNNSNKYKWQNYKDSLAKFLNDNNLVIFTKKGGVLKAQKGLPSLYPGNYSPLNVDKYNVRLPFWTGETIQKPSPIVVPEIQSPYPQIDRNIDILMGTRSNSGNNSDDSNGFFNIKLPRLSYGTLDQGLGWYQYFRDLRDQDKYLQNQIKGLNASRVQDQAVRENQFTYDNPALDRAEANLRNESVRGFKPMTSDATLYNAQQQQAWGKLLDAQAQLTAQRSAADNQINLQNAEIARRNAMNEVATANQNRRTNAAIDAAIFNAQNERVLRRQQSRENKILELRNKLMGDKQLAAQIDAENLQKDYQKRLEEEYVKRFGDLYTQYNNLPASQTKYADFQDYVYQTNPTLWNEHADDFKDLERTYTDAIQNLALNTRLNFPGLTGLMTRQNRPGSYAYGTSSYKKGGYLRGSTRYTKEPDEQIWIDNNKATHRAIAKLSDNTIKLLLRALK